MVIGDKQRGTELFSIPLDGNLICDFYADYANVQDMYGNYLRPEDHERWLRREEMRKERQERREEKWEREERTHDELWQKCYDLYNKTGDPKYIEMMKAIEAGSK